MRLGGREFKEIMSLDFLLAVSTGLIEGFKHQHKFGENPDVGTAFETIWDQGGLYATISTATKVKVSSSSINDTSAGTGARTIKIYGLDSNYNEISEEISLNGQTGVESFNTYIRVYRAEVLTAGSLGTAEGDIYVGTGTITLGIPVAIYATIKIGNNQTLMGVYTIPAGYTGYLRLGKSSAPEGKSADVKFFVKNLGGVYRVVHSLSLFQNNYDYNFLIPVPIPEKSDLEVRAKSSASGTKVTIAFDVILIKD